MSQEGSELYDAEVAMAMGNKAPKAKPAAKPAPTPADTATQAEKKAKAHVGFKSRVGSF